MINLQYKLEETLEGETDALPCAMSSAREIPPAVVQVMRQCPMFSSTIEAVWAGKDVNTHSGCCITAL